MSNFLNFLHSNQYICFDGGMGTMLQGRGLLPGMSPEVFSLERPDILKSIHVEYIQAGADIITSNTFGGTSLKLPKELEVVSFNRKMAQIAKEATQGHGRPVFVAGSVGPTGHFIQPLGELTFREMVEIFKQQIQGLVAGGVDLILAETHFDLAEVRAVVVAAREVSNLPIGVSMTFENGVSLTGTRPEIFKETMLNMGVDLIATNCSAGPAEMQTVVTSLIAGCPVPVLVEPNAGLPELEDGNTVFRLGPEEFATRTVEFAKAGARLLGGCCGTTPAHIAALRKKLNSLPAPSPLPHARKALAVTSRSQAVYIGLDEPVKIIGERINPTGKKQLTAELQAGEFNLALRYAEQQINAGSPILDINVGAPMVDECTLLPSLVQAVAGQYPLPLCVDSSNPKAIELALEAYPGSALVNSINGEPGRIETLAPICLKYGAPFLLLPLTGGNLPFTGKERIAILEAMLTQLKNLGVPNNLILVDVLALAISSSPVAGKAALETIAYCRERNLATAVGLSNISFGMPAREILNSTFLSMAAGAGLCACIANPENQRLQDTLAASNALLGLGSGVDDFVSSYAQWTPSAGPANASGPVSPVSPVSSVGSVGTTSSASGNPLPGQGTSSALSLEQAVINGRKNEVLPLVEAALQAGEKPFAIVQEKLIPAITVVGEKYERKEYFLPQLLKAAETMQTAFSRLKPLLEEDSQNNASRPVIVMATVEGDIHDIGKNIVILMLSNHGFEVIDLGKDVKAQDIVAAAEKYQASLIGLSALMTTTMVRMEDTIKILKEKGLNTKVMIGGAVVTQDFANSIGAAGYSEDAVSCVRLAKKLLN